MANYIRTRLHIFIGLAGCSVFCLGIMMLVSGIKLKEFLDDEADDSYQYWAGIPTILTGVVVILTVYFNKHQSLKYISVCCAMVTMVLALGVIIEESTTATYVHSYLKNGNCKGVYAYNKPSKKEYCDKVKKADLWYYILLFATDIVLVLCSFVMLLLFADWILFVALRTQYYQNEVVHEVSPRYVAMPREQRQQTRNAQYDQSAVTLHPV